MKTFKVVFIKNQSIMGASPQTMILAEQLILTNKEKFDIKAIPGFSILSVTEILQPLTIDDNEKTIGN